MFDSSGCWCSIQMPSCRRSFSCFSGTRSEIRSRWLASIDSARPPVPACGPSSSAGSTNTGKPCSSRRTGSRRRGFAATAATCQRPSRARSTVTSLSGHAARQVSASTRSSENFAPSSGGVSFCGSITPRARNAATTRRSTPRSAAPKPRRSCRGSKSAPRRSTGVNAIACCQGRSSVSRDSAKPWLAISRTTCALLIMCSGLIGTSGSSARNSTNTTSPPSLSARRTRCMTRTGWESSW